MVLNKNTIVCRFIGIHGKPHGGYFFRYVLPLGKKDYRFFVTPKQRESLDIGSVVILSDDNYVRPNEAVIVDNITERNSKLKHKTIKKNPGRHLRGYIKSKYHKKYFAEQIYKLFRDVSHDARVRMAIEQNNKNER